MGSYRRDGKTRKSTSIYLNPEVKYIFESNSSISLSDFLEEQIYEKFHSKQILENKRDYFINGLKDINEKLRHFELNEKLKEESIEKENVCNICNSMVDKKKLLKPYKDKDFFICRKCYEGISPQEIKNKLIEKKENEFK